MKKILDIIEEDLQGRRIEAEMPGLAVCRAEDEYK